MANYQTKDYSYKAHKCLGNNGYKIALEQMTIADAIALNEHMEHMNKIVLSKHAKEQNAERGLNCTVDTFKEMLTDIWNVVELQVQAGNKKALLLREDQEDYALCACVGLNGFVVTVYGNRLDQKHNNKNPKMYRKGGNVEELLK